MEEGGCLYAAVEESSSAPEGGVGGVQGDLTHPCVSLTSEAPPMAPTPPALPPPPPFLPSRLSTTLEDASVNPRPPVEFGTKERLASRRQGIRADQWRRCGLGGFAFAPFHEAPAALPSSPYTHDDSTSSQLVGTSPTSRSDSDNSDDFDPLPGLLPKPSSTGNLLVGLPSTRSPEFQEAAFDRAECQEIPGGYPEVRDLHIEGDFSVGALLAVYGIFVGCRARNCIFRWARCFRPDPETILQDERTPTYQLVVDDAGSYVRVEVVPVGGNGMHGRLVSAMTGEIRLPIELEERVKVALCESTLHQVVCRPERGKKWWREDITEETTAILRLSIDGCKLITRTRAKKFKLGLDFQVYSVDETEFELRPQPHKYILMSVASRGDRDFLVCLIRTLSTMSALKRL